MDIESNEPGSPGGNTAAQAAYDVLLIDDDAGVLLVTGDCLRDKGFSVLTAQNASRAMQQLENKVRVIVLDINLAHEDGLRLMDFLKLNQPETPIIIYTGQGHDDRQVTAMLKRGATCYVHKTDSIHDLSIRDLIFAINTILGKGGTAGSQLGTG